MRVLFISAPIGAGHTRAAIAVAGAMRRQRADIETQITSIFDFIAPQYGQAILRGYLNILAHVPQLYGRMYGWGNTNSMALWGRGVISQYLANKMHRYIHAYQPSIIICTHAAPAGLAAYLLKKQRINIPVIAVITDYVVHRWWIYPEIHSYFVADDALRQYLYAQGIPMNRSQTTGIPVDYSFRQTIQRQMVVERLGLNPEVKTIVMMGGGGGLLPMGELLYACERVKDKLQIIVITGNNLSLYEELRKMQPKLRQNVRVFGYVDNVHEIMSAADLLLSKPGGMTTAEALCMGLPMLLYRPIPGQEEANAQFLVERGVSVCAHSAEEVTELLYRLLFDSDTRADLQRNVRLLQRPLAADCIAKIVLSQFF